MKALLLSLSLIGAVIGASFTARGDDERVYHHRYYEDRDRDMDRSDHGWNDEYWHHHHYGYWHNHRGYWVVRRHHHEFVPDVSVEIRH
jgi:hypothetical protein